jgi:hypothetical protein
MPLYLKDIAVSGSRAVLFSMGSGQVLVAAWNILFSRSAYNTYVLMSCSLCLDFLPGT